VSAYFSGYCSRSAGNSLQPSSIEATRILADGDYVVAECQGDATTVAGEPYANTYCFVIRIVEGKLREMTEYMDTALVERVLGPPGKE
jgi:hypothetical protein